MMLGGKSSAGGRTSLRVAVAGDKGTGKSSLISAVASETFPDNVPRVLPPITLPADAFPDYIPITIVDTPSRSSFFFSLLYLYICIFFLVKKNLV
jgi:Ras family protein T1